MKFSENWLREWVNPSLSAHELSEQLSMAGLEVDGVEPVAGDFKGVLVGEVVECGQHPNADKLRVTKINVGGDELLDIVCGAPNCRQGIKVAVAVVGAVLPGDFKIKKAKLRGEPSFGMLCSFSELGISDDHDGIIELPADAPIGADIRDYLGLDDNAIEVDLTPNRADCLGIRGVAREDVERGQVLAKPGSVTPHTEFSAEVYVLSKDEGGRHTPFFANYRPQFYFRTTDVTGTVTLPEGTEMVMPGDNLKFTVELIAPIAMEDGLRFAIREGGRTVGSGVVSKILE